MLITKKSILNNVCYTELAYERINKKLKQFFQKKKMKK